MIKNNSCPDPRKEESPEQIPTLLKHISSEIAFGFDTVPSPASHNESHDMISPLWPVQPPTHSRHPSISISMPLSPSYLSIEQSKQVPLRNNPVTIGAAGQPEQGFLPHASTPPLPTKYFSQPIQANGLGGTPRKTPRNNRLRDKRFDSFKTWSGKLERQITNLRGRPLDPVDADVCEIAQSEAVPSVHRYFDALEGPELDTLKSKEELVLPEDKKWPFLLRFPVSSFGMCLGVSSQAILWKTLATSPSMSFLHVSLTVNFVLWCIALAMIAVAAIIYSLKIVFYFEAVRREYYHPVRVNFFFAPWIACLFLAIGVPPSITKNLHASLWYVLMAPIFCLELKIYGQWMSGGQRRLSKVANPTNHLSVVGNFVGALLGASMGLKEGPIFFYAVGLAHYAVLFVTLYQRLPTNETLPKELHPVFFLFVAAPSVASMAWANISGGFNYGSRITYFMALFLYVSLAVRINFFRGFKFSLAWWAYTFPMTGAAIATIRYTGEVNNWLTETLSIALSAISTLTVSILFVSTVYHAFVLHDLFPNDISIAITGRRPKSGKKQSHRKTGSSNGADIEACLSV